MSREGDIISAAKNKAQRDSLRKYAIGEYLSETNEPLECVMLLGRLNEAIDTVSALTDDYYTHYIWNSSSIHDKELRDAGFTEDYFVALEDRLIKLRMILMGDNLRWDVLYQRLYADAIGHEVYWKEFYEKRCRQLEYELEKAKKEKS